MTARVPTARTSRRRLFARLVLGSLWRRRARAAIALAAVAIGLSVISALVLVTGDVERMVSRELKAFGPNVVVVPRARQAEAGVGDLSLAAVATRTTLATPAARDLGPPAAPGLEEVRADVVLPVLYGSARLVPDPMHWETGLVAGTDLDALTRLYTGWKWSVARGPAPAGRAPLAVGADLARRAGLAPGDTLTLEPFARGGEPVPAFVARRFEAGGSEDGVAYLPAVAAERLLGLPGRRSVLLVRAAGRPAAIERALAAGWLAGPDREARALRRMSGAERELLRRLRALIGAITLLALATASLCTMSTLTDLVLERRREIGLLKALGASRREVVGLFLAEAAALGAAGGLAGFAIGAVAAQVVGESVFGSTIRIDPLVLPAMLLLAIGVTLLSSLPPVRFALGIEPARVLRGE